MKLNDSQIAKAQIGKAPAHQARGLQENLAESDKIKKRETGSPQYIILVT